MSERAEREAATQAALDGFVQAVTAGRGRARVRPEPGKVSFEEFVQVVRRRRPSDLLPALAAIAAAAPDGKYNLNSPTEFPPWAISLIARESILRGNEHRNAGLRPKDLADLYNAHANLYEAAYETGDDILLPILTRFVYQQFPYQESVFEEIARTHALLIEPLADLDLEVLTENAWTAVFGAPLPQVAVATFFLQVAANQNAGWVDPAWFTRADIAPMLADLDHGVVEQRLDQLSSTIPEFKTGYQAVPEPPGLKQFAYNPLTKRPFIAMSDGRFLAPQPKLIIRTITPSGLYYDGIEALGQGFGRDLGKLTEHYVGRLLAAVDPQIDLRPEITYANGDKSIDWFLTLPSTLVLFEVKSERFRLNERAAVEGFLDRIVDRLNKARKQLTATSTALDQGATELADIDHDLPRLGVIVTAEPFYLANSEPMLERLETAPFPVIVASLRDIEHMAGLTMPDLDSFLASVRIEGFGENGTLSGAIERLPNRGRSPVLEAAWAAYPWMTSPEDAEVDSDDA